jgi:glycine/serine hydroxymethyltransferase
MQSLYLLRSYKCASCINRAIEDADAEMARRLFETEQAEVAAAQRELAAQQQQQLQHPHQQIIAAGATHHGHGQHQHGYPTQLSVRLLILFVTIEPS